MSNLLTRDEFREQVFARDQYECVICGARAVDAHHIIERRLFPDGGYYLDNGASVCEFHHILAEETTLGAQAIRDAIGIQSVVLPPHLYSDNEYTKWGDIINEDGIRTPGELFEDPSVQKILAQGGWLHLYTNYRKYPRTYHLPWSPGVSKDDRVLPDTRCFRGQDVIITEKMDGECTTMYWDGYCHARSIERSYHPSRERVFALAAEVGANLPFGWRVCGENLTAVHSIEYNDLKDFFMVFSIWDAKNRCLDWAQTLEWCALLDLTPVPVMLGPVQWSEDNCRGIYPSDHIEGYVVRNVRGFPYSDFRQNVAKYVRANHVQSHHWAAQRVKWNDWKR